MAENIEQMVALFGPEAPYSDRKKGETIKFFDSDSGTEQTGLITWVTAAYTNKHGKAVPITYIVWTEEALFPTFVYPSDVIAD